MANALLGTASVIDDSRENFNVSADSLDAMLGLRHCSFEAKLSSRMLCSSAFGGDLG